MKTILFMALIVVSWNANASTFSCEVSAFKNPSDSTKLVLTTVPYADSANQSNRWLGHLDGLSFLVAFDGPGNGSITVQISDDSNNTNISSSLIMANGYPESKLIGAYLAKGAYYKVDCE